MVRPNQAGANEIFFFKLKMFVIVTDVQVVTVTLGYRTGTVYTTERLSKIYMKATRQDEKQQIVCNMFVSKAELKHEKPNESQQDIVCIQNIEHTESRIVHFKHTDTLKRELFLLLMALI